MAFKKGEVSEKDLSENDDIIEESSDYSAKTEFNKAAVVLRAFEDVRQKRGKELTRGGWNSKTDKNGNTIYSYLADSRKEFISSMIALDIVLEPDIDEKYKEAREKMNKLLDETYKQCLSYEKNLVEDFNGNTKWVITNKGYIKESSQQGEQWIDNQVEIYTELFREASKLIARKDYFKQILVYG